jgi:hypothetical protein
LSPCVHVVLENPKILLDGRELSGVVVFEICQVLSEAISWYLKFVEGSLAAGSCAVTDIVCGLDWDFGE